MPFGLRNAGQTFQRFIDEVKRGLDFCVAYLEDLLIASRNIEHLRILLTRLSEYGLIIGLLKCVFGVPILDFLGHQVSAGVIIPLESSVRAIHQFELPERQKQLRRFLGMIHYYHRILPHCATLLAPLNDMTVSAKTTNKTVNSSNLVLEWTEHTKAAFVAAKDAPASATLLAHPIHGADTNIMVDASDVAVGGVL